jgi:hypothetical protein
MSEMKKNPASDDVLLTALEVAALKIMKSNKSTTAEKLSAINAGTRIAAIKHRVSGGNDDSEGFFK